MERALPKKTPAAIRRLIRRCLTKDRRQRLQGIGEARIVIEECLSGAPEMAEHSPARRSIVPWAAAAVLTIALIGVSWVAWRATRPPNRPLMQLDIDLGPEVALPTSGQPNNVSLSPDSQIQPLVIHPAGNCDDTRSSDRNQRAMADVL